jgi:hypothetical protein
MLLTYFLNDFEIVPVASIISGITFVFTFHTLLLFLLLLIIIIKALFCPVTYQVAAFLSVQISTTQQIDVPQHFTMQCAVHISVTFCSSVADRWPGSNWRFWSDPFLIVPNTPIITDTIFVLTFYILPTAICKSLYLLSFAVIIIIIIIKFLNSQLQLWNIHLSCDM